uniref:Uncharacterized protein n=1 Tax=Brassica oleracea var. oleracea TaxID=109376 RepID=A0A0D2ZZ26_BRAOL
QSLGRSQILGPQNYYLVFLEFRCYNNAYYAKIGGVSTEEMNKLERTFFFDLDFRQNITTEVFERHCLMLQRETVPCDSRKLRTVLGEVVTCSCQAIYTTKPIRFA